MEDKNPIDIFDEDLERRNRAEENREKIQMLDENFAEIALLLKKRQRTFDKFNDDYDRLQSNFIYADKVRPTERVKSKEEIDAEREEKIKKMNLKKLKEEEEEDEDEEESESDGEEEDDD